LSLWVGIALAVIIIAALAWWFFANPQARETREEIGPGQTLVTAEAGRIVSGFPQELLMESDPQVVKSYRIEYADDNVNQPFLRYESEWNLAENVAAFRDSLRAGAWAVSRAGDATERPETFFQAIRDNETVNIIISEDGDGSVIVSIAYTKG
jgi:hypothetical protein